MWKTLTLSLSREKDSVSSSTLSSSNPPRKFKLEAPILSCCSVASSSSLAGSCEWYDHTTREVSTYNQTKWHEIIYRRQEGQRFSSCSAIIMLINWSTHGSVATLATWLRIKAKHMVGYSQWCRGHSQYHKKGVVLWTLLLSFHLALHHWQESNLGCYQWRGESDQLHADPG